MIPLPSGGTRISLANPTSGEWDNFIAENARTTGAAPYMQLVEQLARQARGKPFKLPRPPVKMVEKNDCTGRNLILCGAGPSLGKHWEHYLGKDGIARMPKTDVWACNSALTWLVEQDAYVTHGFAIDQTEGLLSEWSSCPDVKYIVASSVNPKVINLLLSKNRSLTWFHNYVGSQNEGTLYRTIWPTTVMVGDGLNSANRAMCLAQFRNYKTITVLGADCCLGPDDVMHVNGDGPLAHGATSVIMGGEIDGRVWRTKPDMLFSAVAFAKMAARYGNRCKFIGDTLPGALVASRAYEGTGQSWFKWLDTHVASLEAMTGVPHPSGNPDGRAKPLGRNMASRVFTLMQSAA